jgi:hypothetical protein
MVASARVGGSVFLAAACALAALGSGCGGESSRGAGAARSGGTGGAGSARTGGAGGAPGGAGSSAGTGGVTITDGEGGFVAAAGAGPEAIALDGAECVTRRPGNCEGLDKSSYYSGHGVFNASAELAACSAWVSFDGCGELIYAFDDEGCATTVDPGPGGWKDSEHLSLLRDCLSSVFAEARFLCLASRTFAFYESCYIR